MNILKSIYYKSSSALPLALLKKFSPPTCLFPYHHIVSDEEVLHIKYLYGYKNVSQFTKDLEILLKNFRPISADDLIKNIHTKNKLPRNTFLLTFDDGFREVHDVIAPLLEAKGIPAIFFINPAFINNKKLFYRSKASLLIHELVKNKNNNPLLSDVASVLHTSDQSVDELIVLIKKFKSTDEEIMDALALEFSLSFDDYLKEQRPFLTAEQLTSLSARGFTIGAHSWDHPYYDQLSLGDQIEQTLNSCSYVHEKIHPTYTTFSFPYYDTNLSQQLLNALNKEDIDLLFGIQNQKDELHNNVVHRFNAERPDVSFNSQLKGLLLYLAIQNKTGRLKVKRN
ncbi:MAG: polysaccharide deacetylase family protein [Ginsengibacter sp.]